MTKKPEPLYEHDCDGCRFVGTIFHAEHGWVDIHVCLDLSDVRRSDIIARASDEPANYVAADLISALKHKTYDHPLYIGAKLALELAELGSDWRNGPARKED